MNPLVIISGPTAAGKTHISIELAKRINGSIISADSMQVYKGMDIGSAKIKPEEMCGIDHYLIDELSPFDEFNVVVFKEMALKAISEIRSKGKIPIVVGGTGFYIQALLYDIDFSQSNGENTELRKRLHKDFDEKGADYLFERLKEVDYESSLVIHPNNVNKVIRAIEFYEETGTKISSHNELMHQKDSPYNFAYFVLTKNRENLYEAIDRRVDKMISDGLLKEVTALKEMGLSKDNISMLGLGYKEILDYLSGETTLSEAISIIKRDTRHFAKRQLTWFKREKEVIFYNKDEYSEDNLKAEEAILLSMMDVLKSKEII